MALGAKFAVAQGHLRSTMIVSLKSSCRTSYWSSVDTTALNFLVFGDRQTDERTDEHVKRTSSLRKAPACTSCGGGLKHLLSVNPLMGTGNYSATSNNMKLVHWPLTGGL